MRYLKLTDKGDGEDTHAASYCRVMGGTDCWGGGDRIIKAPLSDDYKHN